MQGAGCVSNAINLPLVVTFSRFSYIIVSSFAICSQKDSQRLKMPVLKIIFDGKSVCGVESHSVMSDSLQFHGLQPARLLYTWNSPDKNTGVGSCSLLQGIFQTHCRWILYHLNHQQNPFHTTVVKFISFGHYFLKVFFCILLLGQLHLY